MSSNEDKCFQCQESGHMVCYCWYIRCFDCYDYGHVAADCPDKILPSGIPARHRDNNSHTRRCDRSTSQNNHHDRHHHHDQQDRHRFSRSCPVHAATDTVAVAHEEVALDPITNPHTAVHHITRAQAHTITDKTPHTADPHHTKVFPETAVDLDHIHHTNTTTKHQQDHLPALIEQPGNQRQVIQAGHH